MGTARIATVTGATGRQGGAVARHLLADGWHVRALTRHPGGDAARRLAALGAEVVAADLADPATLRPAFRAAHGVYSVQNPMLCGIAGEIAQGTNVADAAAEAGVRHLVYASAGTGEPGTGVGSWESKLAVCEHIEQLGLPCTVLRPMAFLELMTDRRFFPPVSTWYLMPKLMGEDRPLGWIGTDDIGAVAAKVFADPDRFAGAELPLLADVRTIGECRALWHEVTGRAPRRFPMPVRLFERVAGTDLTTMWRWLRTADLEFDPEPTRRLLPAARTVRDWLGHARTTRGR
ncbi:uncharacterized protein YbjT (DUF2867 family) [Prauserella shujinwangii]|uniref:Uncharacterized protein YbjT (DUF2867 family) n=1 Tax=Prauserella shujinwangii TaxID=1453103 RepID=A0A2T0LX10_9PSEU|nr:NmrA/HSCARG family protein [Prauserella shujinwangii]PRX48537.1 uncharacterized protein YbjT (DUF2867 family) [Prauserella shujinwangii]